MVCVWRLGMGHLPLASPRAPTGCQPAALVAETGQSHTAQYPATERTWTAKTVVILFFPLNTISLSYFLFLFLIDLSLHAFHDSCNLLAPSCNHVVPSPHPLFPSCTLSLSPLFLGPSGWRLDRLLFDRYLSP